jgi:hypothetical protein
MHQGGSPARTDVRLFSLSVPSAANHYLATQERIIKPEFTRRFRCGAARPGGWRRFVTGRKIRFPRRLAGECRTGANTDTSRCGAARVRDGPPGAVAVYGGKSSGG